MFSHYQLRCITLSVVKKDAGLQRIVPVQGNQILPTVSPDIKPIKPISLGLCCRLKNEVSTYCYPRFNANICGGQLATLNWVTRWRRIWRIREFLLSKPYTLLVVLVLVWDTISSKFFCSCCTIERHCVPIVQLNKHVVCVCVCVRER
jgi:hypothetical protein